MLVIDASATLYLLASGDGIEPFATLELAAPALLWSEATSVLNEMRWRGEVSAALADTAFDRLMSCPIEKHSGHHVYRDARHVGRELGWAKTYDAEYVGLAWRHGVRLLSRDERLRRGASRLITVVGPDDVLPPEHPRGSG